jgi:hypothetical protein
VDTTHAAGLVARHLAATPQDGWLGPDDVQEVLLAFGLPVLRTELVEDAEQAVVAFRAAGRPVAMKAVAEGVLHKAAAGGVRLGLADPAAVAAAAEELLTRFGSRLKGLLVQPMADPGPELLVGVTSDQVFGPLVTVGLGGTSTDLVADRAHRLVPLTEVDAAEMLGDFKAAGRLFDPHHGPMPDRAALLDVVVRVGRLAETLPEVVELDLNHRVRDRRRADPGGSRPDRRSRAACAQPMTGSSGPGANPAGDAGGPPRAPRRTGRRDHQERAPRPAEQIDRG